MNLLVPFRQTAHIEIIFSVHQPPKTQLESLSITNGRDCFLPHFQVGLLAIAPKRFASNDVKSAEFWTATLTGGIMKDIWLIAYLVMRGMLPEAGSVLRRSLEHAGVLTHFLVLAIQPLQFQSRFTKMGSCRLTCGNKIAIRTTSLHTCTPQLRDFTPKRTLA
jgi:hypothetical protein